MTAQTSSSSNSLAFISFEKVVIYYVQRYCGNFWWLGRIRWSAIRNIVTIHLAAAAADADDADDAIPGCMTATSGGLCERLN